MGSSRRTINHNRGEDPKLCVEECTLPIRDNTHNHIRQWQFEHRGFRDFYSSLGIKNQFSSPGHPQANGQMEVTNRTLLKIIKAQLDEAKGAWPEELPNVLWAYRTTTRTRHERLLSISPMAPKQ